MLVLRAAAIAAVLVVGITGCTKDSAPVAAKSDHTAEVCADAKTENAKAASDYTNILIDGIGDAGDPVKAKEYEDKLHLRLAEWRAKLVEWAAAKTTPAVHKVLTDGADMVGRLNEPGGTHIGLAKVQQQFTEFGDKLVEACGS